MSDSEDQAYESCPECLGRGTVGPRAPDWITDVCPMCEGDGRVAPTRMAEDVASAADTT